MEKKELQILSEIRQMIISMRAQLDELEMKVAKAAEGQGIEESDDVPIDIDIEDVFDDVQIQVAVHAPVSEPEVEQVLEPGAEEEPGMEEDVVDRYVSDVLPVTEEELLLSDENDLPAPELLIDAAAANAKPVIIDMMAAKEAWRTAIPGSPVKDIRSAISLHDRIIFINGLFDEDPMLFQQVLTAINSMSSLNEVVDYIAEMRPDWDMESDEVYRFMMAVRRRIQ